MVIQSNCKTTEYENILEISPRIVLQLLRLTYVPEAFNT